MKIQVFSDFRCPFCFIGKTHLAKAIEQSGKDIEIEMMSFELDPNIEPIKGKSAVEQFAITKGMDPQQAQSSFDHVTQMAAKAGLNYRFDKVIEINSFNVHKVFQYAKEQGVGNKFFDLASSYYFEQGKDLSKEETLVELGLLVGLSEAGVVNAINSEDYGYKVRMEESHARRVGVQGVPHFIFDDKVYVSGAQPIETFIEAIEYVEKLN